MANILCLFYVFILIIKDVVKGYSFHVLISQEKCFLLVVSYQVLSFPKKSEDPCVSPDKLTELCLGVLSSLRNADYQY